MGDHWRIPAVVCFFLFFPRKRSLSSLCFFSDSCIFFGGFDYNYLIVCHAPSKRLRQLYCSRFTLQRCSPALCCMTSLPSSFSTSSTFFFLVSSCHPPFTSVDCSEQQEIRTLTLKRGAFNDPTTCTLDTVSLADHPRYTALSYVWGDANDRLPIHVDGLLFSATKNLALALQYIRKADQDQVLWVDAICINQADIDERNNQVSLMGTLYSEAEEVIFSACNKGNCEQNTHALKRSLLNKGNQERNPRAPIVGLVTLENKALCTGF